jgi:hypothetical protein
LRPERNRGFVCVHIKGIKEKKYVMDAFGIYLFLSDPRDIKDSNLMYAEVLEDGKSIGIHRPSLPHAFANDQSSIANAEKTKMCEQTQLELKNGCCNKK